MNKITGQCNNYLHLDDNGGVAKKMKRITIITSGGVVTGAYSTIEDIEVDVIDCDDLKEEGIKDIDEYIDDETEDMFVVY